MGPPIAPLVMPPFSPGGNSQTSAQQGMEWWMPDTNINTTVSIGGNSMEIRQFGLPSDQQVAERFCEAW